ncbi:MAG TPA: DUF1330 domain-containing protein [Asticcacaulis sp.]|nr:DUF1330 domain-containing protein [Asticcacaulis sp.]
MIQIIALLYAGEGGKTALKAYEAKVMRILAEYSGRLVSASHPTDPKSDDPDEVHVVHFESMDHFTAFRADPRHADLKPERQMAIRDVRLFITDQYVTYID